MKSFLSYLDASHQGDEPPPCAFGCSRSAAAPAARPSPSHFGPQTACEGLIVEVFAGVEGKVEPPQLFRPFKGYLESSPPG